MIATNQKPIKPTVRSPQEVFYPGRGVTWAGRLYRVEWCDGKFVGITAMQSPYQCYYEYLPGVFEWNKYVVSVNNVFLRAM